MSSVREDEILLFIYKYGPLRDKDISKEFHDNRGIPRSTYYSYRKNLLNEGRIERTVDEQLNKIYFVPEQHHAELENMKMSNDLLKQFLELNSEDKTRGIS